MRHDPLGQRRAARKLGIAMLILIGMMAAGILVSHPIQYAHTHRSRTAGDAENGVAPDWQSKPSIPKLIELTTDPSKPGEIGVRIIAGVDGHARLSAESDTVVQWVTPKPEGLLTIKRGEAPRTFILRIEPPGPGKQNTVKVRLEFVNEAGETNWAVTQEITLGIGPSPARAAVPTSRRYSGVDTTGHRVEIRVPPNAPAPRVTEGKP
jgi:hypothetical protein